MVNRVSTREAMWLGGIPESWSLVRLGSLFTLRNQKVSDRDYRPLSVSRGGIVPQMEGVAKSDASDDRKLVLTGDFVINSRSDRKGSCGVSEMDGSVSLINLVLQPKNQDTLYGPYLNYLLKNHGFAEEFYRWGHGIVADLWTTRWQEMKSIFLPLPSIESQQRIATYLTKRCAQIDRLIEIEEAQIEKLTLIKERVIKETVTKGLDPKVSFKSSGVIWIGSIPSHWETKRVKYIGTSFAKGSGITKEDLVPDGDIECVRYGDIYSKYDVVFDSCLAKTNLNHVSSPTYFGYGDILFSGTGELIEEIGKNIVYLGDNRCLAGGDIIVMKHRQDPVFLNYALSCQASQQQKSFGKAKLKVVHISASEIKDIIVALPPIEEQRRIGQHLLSYCSKVDSVIKIKKRKIQSLVDYKKSLIFECVTGKKEIPA